MFDPLPSGFGGWGRKFHFTLLSIFNLIPYILFSIFHLWKPSQVVKQICPICLHQESNIVSPELLRVWDFIVYSHSLPYLASLSAISIPGRPIVVRLIFWWTSCSEHFSDVKVYKAPVVHDHAHYISQLPHSQSQTSPTHGGPFSVIQLMVRFQTLVGNWMGQ